MTRCSRDDYPPYDEPAKKAVRALIGVAIALVLLFAAAGTVAAHEVSGIDVRCDRQVIHVEGVKFAEDLPRLVTVTGPSGYSRSFNVQTDNWSHNFPLGPNGAYSIDWPNSGDFGPVPFTVDCAAVEPTPTPRPTPSVAGHTPKPDVTPPPTSSETVALTRPMFSWGDLLVLALILLAITGVVEHYFPETRGARR